MASMRKFGVFAAPILLVAAGAALTGCDEEGGNPITDLSEDVCGDCGDVAKGDVGISGNAKLDGFFAAVVQLDNAAFAARADFEGGLKNLEAAWGIEVDAEADLSARVTELVGKIEGDVDAYASGGIQVEMTPAKCTANLEVSVQAQARCEAKAECDVEVDPGEVSVTCEGSCTGSCEGTCEAKAECEFDAGGIECEGSCEGSCEFEAAAECEGTCRGSCSGECSAYDGEGNCAGSCDGECEGSCEFSAAASCSGTCTGKCTAEMPEAECSGSVKCEGKCEGSCSGGCEGTATPPSASVDCEATAECEAQAEAQASASMECTPPSVSIAFALEGEVEADAEAEFKAKMSALKANVGVMVASFAKYEALITGKVDGETVFDPAPLKLVTDEVADLVAGGEGAAIFDGIPAGRIGCVIPAFETSGTTLKKILDESKDTLEAQGEFVAAFSSGFQG